MEWIRKDFPNPFRYFATGVGVGTTGDDGGVIRHVAKADTAVSNAVSFAVQSSVGCVPVWFGLNSPRLP